MKMNRYSNFNAIRFLAAASFLMSSVCFLAPGSLFAQILQASQPQTGPVIIAGASYNDPPYHFMNAAGKAAGFDIDLLDAVAATADLKISVVLGSQNENRTALLSGRIAILAGAFQTDEIATSTRFCTPYRLVSYSIFARKNSPMASLDDLRGKAIVVRRGDGMDAYAKTNDLSERIAEVETDADALRLVAFGHYDCALLPTDSSQYIAEQQHLSDVVERVGSPIHRLSYGFVVAQGEKDLLDRLNRGMSMVITSGKYKELENKWLVDGVKTRADAAGFLKRYAVAVVSAALALLVIAFLVAALIRQQVTARTAELKKKIQSIEQTNATLKAEKQSLVALLRDAPYGTIVLAGWTWDAEILYCNQAFVKLFGYGPEEAPTFRNLAEKILPDEEYRSRIQAQWQSMGEQGLQGSFTLAVSMQDGSQKHVDFRAGAVGDGRMIVMLTDATEKEQLEEQVRASQKLEAMGRLASGVSHDLNNLLTPILGNAELLLMDDMCGIEDRRALVQEIVNASIKAAELTKQLLAYARKGKFQVVAVDIHQVIHAISGLLQRSMGKHVVIREDLQAARPVIMGDPSQIHGALLNLGVNARDAMPTSGTLVLSTRMVIADNETCRGLSHEITPGQYVEIRVSDTGTGMTKEVRKHLFEPFFTTKQVGKGTGLGLAAVYGCIKNHHGTIRVESEPGKGTTFFILLPSVGKAVVEDHKISTYAHGTGHILLVDDEETVRSFIGKTLEKLGYRVTLCPDGASAVELFKEHHDEIDLVILDIIMPGLDGNETMAILKTIDPAVRVLIESGYATDKTVSECMQKGALGFLAKPCQIEDLAKAVASCMGATTTPPQAIST